MSLLFHPDPGTVLRVDLNEGFRIPEMRKRRPAIIMSAPLANREQLCSIVPLSTNEPRPMQPFCCIVEFDPPLPWPYQAPKMWVKADMIMTVAFHRLKLLDGGRGPDGDRLYDIRNVGPDKLREIQECIRVALGM